MSTFYELHSIECDNYKGCLPDLHEHVCCHSCPFWAICMGHAKGNSGTSAGHAWGAWGGAELASSAGGSSPENPATWIPRWWAGALSSVEGEQKVDANVQAVCVGVPGCLVPQAESPEEAASMYVSKVVIHCPRTRLSVPWNWDFLVYILFCFLGCWLSLALQTQGKLAASTGPPYSPHIPLLRRGK